MVLKMAKTKIGEIEILVFRNRGSTLFRAAAKKIEKVAHLWGFHFRAFAASDTNSHQPIR